MKVKKFELPKIKYTDEKQFDEIDDFIIQSALFIGQDGPQSFAQDKFDEVIFRKIIFKNEEFRQVGFVDVIFENSDLSGIEFENCLFRRVQFVNCKLIGTSFNKCRFTHVEWSSTLMKFSMWSLCKIEQSIMRDSNLDETRFFEVEFQDIQIEFCSFSKTEFIETPLKDCNVSTSFVDGWTIDPKNLIGIKVNTTQAVDFARLLGIEVAE